MIKISLLVIKFKLYTVSSYYYTLNYFSYLKIATAITERARLICSIYQKLKSHVSKQ